MRLRVSVLIRIRVRKILRQRCIDLMAVIAKVKNYAREQAERTVAIARSCSLSFEQWNSTAKNSRLMTTILSSWARASSNRRQFSRTDVTSVLNRQVSDDLWTCAYHAMHHNVPLEGHSPQFLKNADNTYQHQTRANECGHVLSDLCLWKFGELCYRVEGCGDNGSLHVYSTTQFMTHQPGAHSL